ncbi:MAG: AAA family ATPase [Rhizobiaceae bacterium]|nr:AAA family ATPase [Rhizobiaceae bacterium]
MIRKAEIQNFKCFKLAKIANARRINVIVGENGVGKTALLEALFFAAGPSPEIAIRIQKWRGLQTAFAGPGHLISTVLWQDLFNNFDMKKGISVSFQGDNHHNRSLRIFFDDQTPSLLSLKDINESTSVSARTPRQIVFQWRQGDIDLDPVMPKIVGDQFQMDATPPAPFTASFFSSTYDFSSDENVSRFSAMTIEKRRPRVTKVVRELFPEIIDLGIELRGGRPVIHADIEHLPQKMPIGSISSGINKMISILLALEANSAGILLVDEIENGLHHSIHGRVWREIYRGAEESNAQVFTTTHSLEALQALVDACGDNLEDIGFYQMRRERGVTVIDEADGITLARGLQLGEVR